MGVHVEMANVALEAGPTVSAKKLAEAWEQHAANQKAPEVPPVLPSFHVRVRDPPSGTSAPVEVPIYRGSSSESEDRAQETITRQSVAQAQAQDEWLGIVDSDRDAAEKPPNPDEPAAKRPKQESLPDESGTRTIMIKTRLKKSQARHLQANALGLRDMCTPCRPMWVHL